MRNKVPIDKEPYQKSIYTLSKEIEINDEFIDTINIGETFKYINKKIQSFIEVLINFTLYTHF